MEKALLKVTRFNNSDVIATSSVCAHQYHWHITQSSENESKAYVYEWTGTEWKLYDDREMTVSLGGLTVGATYGDCELCNDNYPHS